MPNPSTTTFLPALGHFLLAVQRRFFKDRCPRVAGSLAFTTVVAIVPLTIVGISVLSVFPVFDTWMVSVQAFVYGNFVPTASEVVSRYIQQLTANVGKLTVLGLVFLFVVAVMMIATIELAFNDIWHVHRRRKLSRRFVAYSAVIIFGPVLMGLSLSITSYFVSLPLFNRESSIHGVRQLLLAIAPIVFEWTTFFMLYTVVPNCPVRLRHASLGALLATLLFEIAKRGFSLFVMSFPNYRTIYGAVVALPLFLIWVYLSWMITLLGAQLTATLPYWRVSVRAVTRAKSGTENARTRKSPRASVS